MNHQLNFMLQQALQAFQSNNFDRADSILKKVLQADSKNFPALHILGLIKASQGKFKEASELLTRAARINPNDASIQYNLAKAMVDCGANKESIPHHKKAVELASNNPDAWLNYGKALSQLALHEQALINFEKAIALNANFAEAWFNKGKTLHELERYEEAISCFDSALNLKPDFAEAWSNKGNALNELKRYEEAISCFDTAINHQPYFAEAWLNKGGTQHELKRYEEAINCFNTALKLKPDFAQAWSNKGNTLHELKRYEAAIDCFEKALNLKPDLAEAWSNQGNTLQQLKRYEAAINCFDKALGLQPNFTEAWSNKGSTLHQLMHYDEAIDHYEKAINLNPNFVQAWSSKGNALEQLKQYEAAVAHYEKALSLNPNTNWGLGSVVHLKMKMCDWDHLAENIKKLQSGIQTNKKNSHPFHMLALIDDESLQKKSAEIYSQDQYLPDFTLGAISKIPRHNKIRIGYFSTDFRHHPVSILTAELFELHDKNQFEIIAFSLGFDDKSPMRARLSQSFDQFIDVSGMSDLEIVKLARKLEIDIAVDLGGFTSDNRTGIFALRAAPVQMSYIGYLGTMGSQYIDYLFADKIIVPEDSKQLYSEKIAYLPSYQANDSHRKIADKVFTRAELGIPQDSFVFACFNNNYKILPATFDSWMRILKATDRSILFLYAENEWAQKNLLKEAEARGIESQRIIFGTHLPTDEYLARYQACDLFLDTAPYNAGTTASDALWAGLPVLTLIGKSFASRVAASLLTAIDLPELITSTQSAYEAQAIELAHNPDKLASIKEKLAQNRSSTQLFNTSLFTKNIEAVYTKIYQRYQEDLPPDHISIH